MGLLSVPDFVSAANSPSPSSSSSTATSDSAMPTAVAVSARRGRTPRRKIFTEQDLAPWLRSSAYADLETTILRLTAAVEGKVNDAPCPESAPVRAVAGFLSKARGWIGRIPLAQGPQRFGNKAFRDWLAKVEEAEGPFQRSLLVKAGVNPSLAKDILPELSFHLLASFGSPQRLDYGTGHELSFVCYLVCLCRIRVFSEADEQALVTRVFKEYIDVCREVQKVFRLEPAGSKGVWGLDDHQHLVYLFGASQLTGHATLRPSSILSVAGVESLAPSYLFLSSISHIHELKCGPFHEHSPLLHQIATTVPSWTKVTKGLWDMYKVEVLGKVPVVQHCRFGEVGMRWTDTDSGEPLPSTGDGRADDEDAEDAPVLDGGPVITPAPWTRAEGTGSALGGGPVSPLTAAPRQLGASTTVSTQFSSAAHSRRQQPTTFPLAPASVRPTSFAPPPLFAPRGGAAGSTVQTRATVTSARAPPRDLATDAEGKRTVADLGGAAALSSPFGTLPAVGSGHQAERNQ